MWVVFYKKIKTSNYSASVSLRYTDSDRVKFYGEKNFIWYKAAIFSPGGIIDTLFS